MIKITISNVKTSLFRIDREFSKFGIQYTSNNIYRPLCLERLGYNYFKMLTIGEPVTIELQGDFECIIEAKMTGFSIFGLNIAADVTFEVISVTIPEQDDYKRAYDRAMAIIKR